MKIDAQMTLLLNSDGLVLELHDKASGRMFFEGSMDQAQTCLVLSRCGYTDFTDSKVMGLDVVGKKHECESFRFPITDNERWGSKDAIADKCRQIVKEQKPGWKPDLDFDSQTSFAKDGEAWFACTIIRRWV
ncbi:MAG: hypothetical protein PQJ59_16705 [Spirochaetales bacterium]|nr:hypothetical protein [Spirochaetales bacterium]